MTGRAKTQVHIVIDRKPEDVFAYLADVQKHKDWSPKAYRVEGLDGPVQLGTTFTSYGWVPKDADHRNDVEVTAFEPSTRIEFTGREKGEDFVNTYVLIPEGNATRIDRTLDFPKFKTRITATTSRSPRSSPRPSSSSRDARRVRTS